MNRKNLYDVLGVRKDASEKDIKSAFRKLAKKWHPDQNAGNAEAEKMFKEANEAYTVLGDPEKRKLYDKYGEASLQEGFDPQKYEEYMKYASSDFSTNSNQNGFSEFSFDGNFDDLFSGLFGNGTTGRKSRTGNRNFNGFSGFGGYEMKMRGSDIETEIRVSFDEAVKGCERPITLEHPDKTVSTISAKIPAGINDGQKVRLKGQGNPGVNGGESGDLLLKIRITPKKGFERNGKDIIVTAEVPFETAVFGGEIIVPTLDGKVSCKIKPGTQCGSKIRLRGKGIQSINDPSSTGDEYIIVKISVPKKLNTDEERTLREYADLRRKTA